MPARPRLPWIEPAAAEGRLAQIYDGYMLANPDRQEPPQILKALSHSPALMDHVAAIGQEFLFTETRLSIRVKELLAVTVSGANHCPYCYGSHAYRLCRTGVPQSAIAPMGALPVTNSTWTAPELALIEFARKLNQASDQIEEGDFAALRTAGWSDAEIAEAIHVISLYAFFNRVANAYGLQDPGYLPPQPAAAGG